MQSYNDPFTRTSTGVRLRCQTKINAGVLAFGWGHFQCARWGLDPFSHPNKPYECSSVVTCRGSFGSDIHLTKGYTARWLTDTPIMTRSGVQILWISIMWATFLAGVQGTGAKIWISESGGQNIKPGLIVVKIRISVCRRIIKKLKRIKLICVLDEGIISTRQYIGRFGDLSK
jgi:hypothetical protein